MYKKSLDRATLGRVERARAAEANAFENLPVFAAAVICGNMAGLDVGTLNSVSSDNVVFITRVLFVRKKGDVVEICHSFFSCNTGFAFLFSRVGRLT